MNQNAFVGITIALILTGIGAWWYTHIAQSQSESPAVVTATTPAAVQSSTNTPVAPTPIKNGTPSFKSLLTQKGNYQCDYEQTSTTGKSHNVIYLSDGKLRAEFRSTMAANQGANLSVYDGHYLYTWREGTSVGTKTAITALGQLPTAIPKDLTSGAIYGDNYDSVGWQCHTWLVDKTLLTPPSYVTFK